MNLHDLAARFSQVRWNAARDAWVTPCPRHPESMAIATVEGGRLVLKCHEGCTADEILASEGPPSQVRTKSEALDSPSPADGTISQSSASAPVSPPPNGAGHHPRFVNGAAPALAPPSTDDILRRVPPQNLEAEQSVLGAILLKNESIKEILELVGVEDFYRESHRVIYRAMRALSQDGEGIDAITLGASLRDNGALETIGGPSYIADLAACVPTARNIVYYARIVREKSVLRQFAAEANQITTLAYDGGNLTALMDKAAQLSELGKGESSKVLKACDADTFFRETEHLENIRWRWDRIAPSCGLIGIFGDPEAGKSTFSRTLALALASGADCLGRSCLASRVLYLDLAGETVSHRRAFKKLGWTGNEMKLLSTSEYLAGDPRALQVMADLFTGERIEVVFVDMMADLLNFKDLNDYANAKETMSKLRRLAVATNTLIIVLHHTPKALPPDADVLKAGLGSQAIVGSFDLRIAIRRRSKGLGTITMSKGKLGGESLEGEFVITCDPATENVALGMSWGEKQKDFYGDKIFEMLAQDIGARMGASAIAEALGIEPSHIRGALSKLVKDSKVEREGKGKRGDGFRYWVTDAQQAIYGKLPN